MKQSVLTLMAVAVCVALRTSEDNKENTEPKRKSRNRPMCTQKLEDLRGVYHQEDTVVLLRKQNSSANKRPILSTEEAILPIASSCCTEVSHHISRRLLERVNSCSIQRADGDCDLAAVILHVKRRRICISPHNHTLKQWMRASEVKKNGKANLCQNKKQHSRKDRKGHTLGKHGPHVHKTPR